MISLNFNDDGSLALVAACDTALTVLSVKALQGAMSDREINRAEIQLRDLRARLLKGRGEALERIISNNRQKIT